MIVGSYVPDGVAVGRWVAARPRSGVTAFYDIDTPVTLAKLARGDHEYLSPRLIPRLRPLPVLHRRPDPATARAALRRAGGAGALLLGRSGGLPRRWTGRARWDLGYLGTYSADRQPTLERLLLEPARALRRSCASSSPARNIPATSPGRPTSSASSTCRRPSTPPSTPPALHPERHPRRHDRGRLVARACGCSRRRPAARRSSPTSGTGSRRSWRPDREILLARDAGRRSERPAPLAGRPSAAPRRGGAPARAGRAYVARTAPRARACLMRAVRRAPSQSVQARRR